MFPIEWTQCVVFRVCVCVQCCSVVVLRQKLLPLKVLNNENILSALLNIAMHEQNVLTEKHTHTHPVEGGEKDSYKKG